MVLATGTRTSVNESSAVSLDHMPSFSSLRDTDHAGDVGRHHDERHAAGAGVVRGAGQQAEPVGLGAVGDVELGAVDDPLVPVAHGPGPDAGHVAAGVGLGHRNGGDDLAADGRRQVALLELGRAVAGQRRRGHRHLHGHGHGDAAAADPPHLLAGDQGEGVVGAHAAVGLVVLEPEQADGRQLGEELVGGERAGRLPLVDVGLDLPLEEVPERLAEELVLVALDHRRTIPPALFHRICGHTPTLRTRDGRVGRRAA